MDGVDTNLNVTGASGTDVSTLTRIGINIDTFFAGDGNVDFAGNMDDLNFYNVALNSTQIGQLYSSNTVTERRRRRSVSAHSHARQHYRERRRIGPQ